LIVSIVSLVLWCCVSIILMTAGGFLPIIAEMFFAEY
jgi:hypothetical protein